MKPEIRAAIILAVVISGAVGGLGVFFSSLETQTNEIQHSSIADDSSQNGTNQDNIGDSIKDSGGDYEIATLQERPRIDKSGFKKAPSLVGISHYVNTAPKELQSEIEGKVVLYDIWTYSCINCVRTLPYITEWHDKYADDGLLVIGIHSPEFEFEKNLSNVQMAVAKHGIMYPVVLDNDKKTWKAFENRYWPRKYIADHEGFIRYDHIGEGAYEKTEQVIQQLLKERAADLGFKVASAQSLVDIEAFEHTSFRTPELYFGYKFAQGRNQLGNSEGFSPENDVKYVFDQKKILQNYFYMEGTWKNLEGSMRLVSEHGSIVLPYHAKEVNIVAASEANLLVYLDGKPIPPQYQGRDTNPDGTMIISEPGLYNIVNSEQPGTHLLEIQVADSGFEIYTFTFG